MNAEKRKKNAILYLFINLYNIMLEKILDDHLRTFLFSYPYALLRGIVTGPREDKREKMCVC